jgi:hypothetical protein
MAHSSSAIGIQPSSSSSSVTRVWMLAESAYLLTSVFFLDIMVVRVIVLLVVVVLAVPGRHDGREFREITVPISVIRFIRVIISSGTRWQISRWFSGPGLLPIRVIRVIRVY